MPHETVVRGVVDFVDFNSGRCTGAKKSRNGWRCGCIMREVVNVNVSSGIVRRNGCG